MSKSQDELLDELIARHVGQSARETTTSRMRAAEAASANRAQPMAYSATTNVAPGYGASYEERYAPRPRPVARRRAEPAIDYGKVAAVIGGITICFVIWLIGAKYTIEGMVYFANWMAQQFNAPTVQTFPLPTGFYLWLMPIPLLFSIIEFRTRLIVRTKEGSHLASTSLITVWLIFFIADLATTFFGSIALMTPIVAGLLTAIVTVGPEWLLRSLIRELREALRM